MAACSASTLSCESDRTGCCHSPLAASVWMRSDLPLARGVGPEALRSASNSTFRAASARALNVPCSGAASSVLYRSAGLSCCTLATPSNIWLAGSK